MKKILLALTATAAVAAPIALTAAPALANPGSPGCMTKAEWYRIHEGTYYSRVKAIVGSGGVFVDRTDYADGQIDIEREFRQCKANGKPASSWHTVWISFSNVTYDDDYNEIRSASQRVSYKGSWSRV
jgi:hypothetical protein